ncbi:MAG: GLPGLI family protein [Bacteroidota bacterium]
MLKICSTLTIAILAGILTAPPSAGTAVYEFAVKLNIQLPPGQEALLAQLPTESKSEKILHFTSEASLFMDPPADEESDAGDMSAAEGGVNINIVMGEPENRYFKNLVDKTKTEKLDFLGRVFLIQDKLNSLAWKITGKQKVIMDYTCQQATAMRDTTPIEVWFAPQIPVSTGPGSLGGLPGLIVEASIDNGQQTYRLKSLDLTAPDPAIMVPPKKGKKVNQEEFNRIQAEKMKEMEMENGGNGTMIKVIRR